MCSEGSSSSVNETSLGNLYVSLSGYNITVAYFAVNLFLSIVGMIISILNSFVVYVIMKLSSTHDVVFIFLIHLAIADTAFGIILIYNTLYNLLHFKNLFECLFRFGIMNGIIVCSFLHLVGLNFERYIKIVFPYQYTNMFQRWHVKTYASVVWMTAGAVAIVPTLSWIGVDHEYQFCLYFGVLSHNYLMTICVCLVGGCCFLSFMYCHILVIASSKLMPPNVQRNYFDVDGRFGNSVRAMPLWWKPTKTVLLIVGVNLVALMPAGIYLIVVLNGGLAGCDDSFKGTLLTYTAAPAFLNGLVNPVIYAHKIPSFKRSMNNICFGGNVNNNMYTSNLRAI